MASRKASASATVDPVNRGREIELAGKPLNSTADTPVLHRAQVKCDLLAVYDGAERVGELDDHGRRRVDAFAIVEAKRKHIGTFATRIEAMRAIGRNRERADD
jgi:hypothetical protein